MADTTFTDNVTVIRAAWLNEVNALVHKVFGNSATGLTAPMFNVATGDLDFLTSAATRLKISAAGDISTGGTGAINVNGLGTGNRSANIDLVGDATYTDYGLRVIRNNTGPNANSDVLHRGTGILNIASTDSGTVSIKTSNVERINVSPTGVITLNGTVNITNQASIPQSGLINRVINGDTAIAQRGTSTSTNNGIGVDRFKLLVTNLVTGSLSQVNSTTISVAGHHHVQLASTSTKPTLVAGDQFAFQTSLEGTSIKDLRYGTSDARAVTLSFRALSNINGFVLPISFRNVSGTLVSYVTTVTLTTAPATYTITVPGATIGTWFTDISEGLRIGFGGSLGTTFQAPSLATWVAGTFFGHSSGGNLHNVSGNQISITDIQLEIGTVATTFEVRPAGTELDLCRRYYQTLLATMRFLATNAGQLQDQTISFTPMRATPTTATLATRLSSNVTSMLIDATDTTLNSGRLTLIATAAGDCFVLGRSYSLSAEF